MQDILTLTFKWANCPPKAGVWPILHERLTMNIEEEYATKLVNVWLTATKYREYINSIKEVIHEIADRYQLGIITDDNLIDIRTKLNVLKRTAEVPENKPKFFYMPIWDRNLPSLSDLLKWKEIRYIEDAINHPGFFNKDIEYYKRYAKFSKQKRKRIDWESTFDAWREQEDDM